MRHAIIGAGFGAQVHLPAFKALPGVQVIAIADAGSGRAKASATSDVAVYSDWRRLLDEQRPDTISVTVPPPLQYEIVTAAIARGVHVLCEKPAGTSPASVAQLMEQASAASVVVAVGFQYRFESAMEEFRKQVLSGSLGGLRTINFSWVTSGRADLSRPWSWQNDAASGGGVINGFLPHVTDLLFWQCGVEVRAVRALTNIFVTKRIDADGNCRQVTAEDAIEVHCELNGGGTANLYISNCQIGGNGMRIEVYGDRGVARYSHKPPFVNPATCRFDLGNGEIKTQLLETAIPKADTRLRPMLRLAQLFAASANGATAIEMPTLHDALRSQRFIAAVRASAAGGERVAVL